MKLRLLPVTSLILLGSFKICLATITVDSVIVTPSTCPNNGTATIYAHSTSDSAVFLYNVTAGPVLYPQQNDSTFASLYPGTYTAWVHDINSYDSTETIFTITGNYQAPDFNPNVVGPLCLGDSNGLIIGNPVAGTGLPPYTWQVTTPFLGAPQASDTLGNLPGGSYTISITDVCDVSRTKTLSVDSGGTGLILEGCWVSFLGCDTAVLYIEYVLKQYRAQHQIKFDIMTDSQVIHKTIVPGAPVPGAVLFGNQDTSFFYLDTDILIGINFGDYVNVCLTDTCNITVCDSVDSINPFVFNATISFTNNNCVPGFSGSVSFANNIYGPYYPVDGIYRPLTVTLQNLATQVVVDSFIHLDTCHNCLTYFPLPPEPGGVSYLLSIKDACGNLFQDTIQSLSSQAQAQVYQVPNSCRDSTGGCAVRCSGFITAPTLEFTSGPDSAESTKPVFGYSPLMISYPVTFANVTNTGQPYYIINMPAGTYTYNIFDSCGNTISGILTITEVGSYNLDYYIKKVCGGGRTLYINNNALATTGGSALILYNPYQILFPDYVDSFLEFRNLATATYYFQPFYNFDGGFNAFFLLCSEISYPIVISGDSSLFKATDVATCNGTIYIHIEVDSNNGMPPFQYEIISGPQTFAPQDSNTFTVYTYGTYLLGVIDSCGNVDTRQVTIDTGRFDPVVKSGGWCSGSTVQLSDVSSPYFTYVWLEPNGNVFTGDTLLINPFTAADTGVYQITKIIQINGCRDSAYGSYDLVFKNTFEQSVSFCPGDTLNVGPYAHTVGGIYYDTLSGAYGCDSIEVTTLTVFPTQATISSSNPSMCRTNPVTLTASGGSAYAWSNSEDTSVITVNPITVIIYTVTVTDTFNCSVTAGAVVYPAIQDSVQLNQTFCSGDTFYVGIHAYTQSGNYIDILTGIYGCDSFIYTTLTVFPTPQAAIVPANPPMCHTNPTTLIASGGTIYTWSPGNYNTDTITPSPEAATVYTVTVSDTSLCSATASVTVYPVSDSIVNLSQNKTIICPTDSAMICAAAGFNTYLWNNEDTARCITTSLAGNYYVTATNSLGCSITSDIAALEVYPVTPVTITVSGDTLIAYNASSYQWYLNNAVLSGDTDSILIASGPGEYSVAVGDSNGCIVISNNQDITGINKLQDEMALKIYPDPVTDELNISYQLNSSANLQITITDITGRRIATVLNEEELSGNYLQRINIRNLASAVYILTFTTENGNLNLRFVKE